MTVDNRILAIVAILLLFACENTEFIPPSNNTLPVDIAGDSITFAIIGDYGDAGDPAYKVSEMVKSWNPDFIITMGDNNYETGELSTIEANVSQYYGDYIYNPDAPEKYKCSGNAASERKNRFFPTLGNHDQDGSGGYLPYLLFFDLPGKEIYYDFEWGPIHFFTINSGKETDHTCCESEQAKWMKEQLAQSTKPFKLVYFHHPPYSASDHGNYQAMQWPFEEWGADAVFSGHDHVYERIVKRDNPNFPYIVNGLGGRTTIYGCHTSPLDDNEFGVICYNKNYGAMKCEATADKVILRFYAIDDPINHVNEFIIQH